MLLTATGPVLLAGAEVINLLKSNQFEINDRVFPTEKIVNRHELIRKIRGATRLQANGDSKVSDWELWIMHTC
jgi:hypothetical protein